MNRAPVRAYIGLGSNLDDPVAQVQRALKAIEAVPGISLRRVSRFYRSAPWGGVVQPDFINAVAEIDSLLSPQALLQALQNIEQRAGRQREQRWGPRTLDLDVLLFGSVQQNTAQLQLPHPHMHERAFVLAPLAELAPQLVLGAHGRVAECLARLDVGTLSVLPDHRQDP